MSHKRVAADHDKPQMETVTTKEKEITREDARAWIKKVEKSVRGLPNEVEAKITEEDMKKMSAVVKLMLKSHTSEPEIRGPKFYRRSLFFTTSVLVDKKVAIIKKMTNLRIRNFDSGLNIKPWKYMHANFDIFVISDTWFFKRVEEDSLQLNGFHTIIFDESYNGRSQRFRKKLWNKFSLVARCDSPRTFNTFTAADGECKLVEGSTTYYSY